MPLLNEADYEQADALARRDGTFAGLSSALVAGMLSSRVYKLSRTTAVATAIATGALAGWQFTQAFRASTIAQIRAQRAHEAAQVQLAAGTPGDSETTAA